MIEMILPGILQNPWWFTAASLASGLIILEIILISVKYALKRSALNVKGVSINRLRIPLATLISTLIIKTAISQFDLPAEAKTVLNDVLSILLVIAIVWLVFRLLSILEKIVNRKYDINTSDNLKARKIQTQFKYLKRIFQVIFVIVAFAWCLMIFERFRGLGASILASAGIMGLVVGLAAQQSFSNLLVGLQIAFTQPIRLDDVVIIEGEWGRIEEITATYAVIRIWDLRRMVVPLTYFIEKPFQNWTRVSADLLGTVYIYTDYSAEVDIIREELHRLLKSSEKWDGKVWGLQVTDATEKTMQLRALMSAADSSAAWGLRCEIREKLIGYIQKEFPDSLPALKISDGIPDRTNHENN